jgi:hypothetical protein
MPSNLINAYSIKLKRPIKELEKKWEEAKQKAIDAGKKESDKKFYAYVVTVFQHLLGINDEDVIPLELHKIDNSKAFRVTEGVIPSFRDFVNESIVEKAIEHKFNNKNVYWLGTNVGYRKVHTKTAKFFVEEYKNYKGGMTIQELNDGYYITFPRGGANIIDLIEIIDNSSIGE